MKKIFIVLLCCLIFKTGSTAILKVGKGMPYTTIKSALQAAVDGDVIYVYPGLYQEQNIIIDKRITLKGVQFPTLDGEKKYEVLSIKAHGVWVEGLRVIRSGVSSIKDMGGIKVYDANDVTIQNNILEETFFGIYIQYGSRCNILRNRVYSSQKTEQQSGNGIHAWKSDSLQISGNLIQGHRDGIYLEFATRSNITENISEGNLRYGLHFMFSHDNHYYANVFSDNGAGVAVMYSQRVEMRYNVFKDNWGDAAYGLLLKEMSDCKIENNHFQKNTVGIYLEGASRISMKENNFELNGWAMKLMASCMDVNVTRCNFLSNTFDVGTNGSLVLNHFKNNYWDKYEGYDLNRNGEGDVPYRPVSLFSMVIEKNPPAMILIRSFMATLLDRTEKMIPTITPENLKDESPMMKPLKL
ncbi:MAG TPA: nitrous oxide reductase family maturation protein NosD [Ferruginibacter sp.]|mgnify:FL=1|nr:nitrous oxide reductase family maturation protein NosD [Ferruginibacter sp.]HRO06138.1 nitrous oxide reductase family maturation protein NosD [Ferruginibacter sp.]HRO97336.1 nitrous oxide reductase family maturation protein NosD [Ferruginibacter sp.]HRP50549.1 nitrous oxide reductase family maturation protein NosD [Ferruginibacter sp.]